MKLHLALVAAAVLVPGYAAAQQSSVPQNIPNAAQYGTYGVYGIAPGERNPETATPGSLWRIRILALRREALELARQDGGTLTPEHRAMLQAKLDRINAQARQR